MESMPLAFSCGSGSPPRKHFQIYEPRVDKHPQLLWDKDEWQNLNGTQLWRWVKLMIEKKGRGRNDHLELISKLLAPSSSGRKRPGNSAVKGDPQQMYLGNAEEGRKENTRKAEQLRRILLQPR
ncbi:unnamed protein product [Caretta caretta]